MKAFYGQEIEWVSYSLGHAEKSVDLRQTLAVAAGLPEKTSSKQSSFPFKNIIKTIRTSVSSPGGHLCLYKLTKHKNLQNQ